MDSDFIVKFLTLWCRVIAFEGANANSRALFVKLQSCIAQAENSTASNMLVKLLMYYGKITVRVWI